MPFFQYDKASASAFVALRADGIVNNPKQNWDGKHHHIPNCSMKGNGVAKRVASRRTPKLDIWKAVLLGLLTTP